MQMCLLAFLLFSPQIAVRAPNGERGLPSVNDPYRDKD